MNVAERLKNEGQQAVWDRESEVWRERALDTLHNFAEERSRFNADDFREYAESKGLGQPRHVNSWGSLFTTAARYFWIRKSGKYDASKNPDSHAHAYVIWESCLLPTDVSTVVTPESTNRFEIRAKSKPGSPGLPGLTFSTMEKAKSSVNVKFYCETFGAKSEDLIFANLVKPE